MGMPLDELITAKADTPARAAALNLNLAFAPGDYPHEGIRGGSSSRNPVILRRILDPLASESRQSAAEGVELAEWFLAHVQVPKGKARRSGCEGRDRSGYRCGKAQTYAALTAS